MPSSFTNANAKWESYRRKSDHKLVQARIQEDGEGNLFMQIREARAIGSDFCCPHCNEVITRKLGAAIPDFHIEPSLFDLKHDALV